MILYIHGFGSSGRGFKVTQMKQWFSEQELLSPSLSYIPELAIDTLRQLIECLQQKEETVQLIGSSLGGFYALYLAEYYNLRTVLINPALNPFILLQQAIGQTRHYYDDSSFLWTEEHVKMLRKYEVDQFSYPKNVLLLVQQFDEVLNAQDALDKLPNANQIIDKDGDHGYGNIDKRQYEIINFLRQ